MKRMILMGALAAAIAAPGIASAGVYTDDMTKCLVSSATPADNEALVKWVFAALSSHPAVKPMTTVTQAQREAYSRGAVKIMERLLLQDCRKQSIMAMKVEGSSAIETSFGVLGQVAFRGLMTDPGTMAQIAGLATYMDRPAWEALMKEAGLPTAPPAK
ncbi:hypothetical protein [Phenylobacterium sp.]|uniref:hypothetical protein n=1 Tax=Phenylobacterium sp. TaxID=1871053 RepID=UPI002DE236BB|nr:hypothetical protein [Phenylobacterium sp.]